MRLVEGNTINFITQGQANRGQAHQNPSGAGNYNKGSAAAAMMDDDTFN